MLDHRIPATGLEADRVSAEGVCADLCSIDQRGIDQRGASTNGASAGNSVAYVPPQLTHLGRVRDLTAGANSGAQFDGIRSKVTA